MNKIRELPESSSRFLTSSQIITSVFSIAKELVENAVDSDSKNVEIRLENYGLDEIEVKDTGSGIYKEDIPFVAKPHCTSKITSHLDLDKVETYGFRGEALSAICAVADVMIMTKTARDDVGCCYSFNHKGDVMSSKPCSCVQGSTVSAQHLFQNLPVRKQYYRSEKKKKEELKRIEDLLFSFGCILPGVRYALYHNKSLIWQKAAVSDTNQALIQMLGRSVVEHMEHDEFSDELSKLKIKVYLPKYDAPLTCSSTSSSRCIVSVNGRPARMQEITKLLKEHYSKCVRDSSKPRYPTCYISISVPLCQVDVNIEPNKTTVLMHNLDIILEQLDAMLKRFYSVDLDVQAKCGDIHVVTESVLPQTECISKGKQCVLKSDDNCRIQQSSLDVLQLTTPTREPVKSKENMDNLFTPVRKKKKTNSQCISSSNDVHSHLLTLEKFLSQDKDKSTPKSGEKSSILGDNSDLLCSSVTTIKNSNINKNACDISINNLDTKETSQLETSDGKKCLSKPCAQLSASNGSITSNPDEAVAWSRGVDASSIPVKPVTVLAPKMTEAIDATNKRSCGGENLDSINNNERIQATIKESSSTNFERKLTAFDIFCRRNRLEIAAQNPELNTYQIAQILAEKWRLLSSEEKIMYKNMLTKSYPKDIKGKDKLGKTISQNLLKRKNASSSPKNVQKKVKQKLKEKEVVLDMLWLKKASSIKSNLKISSDETLDVINYLAPGIWLCSRNSKLYLLNTFRLQETIIYHRLLKTFHFEAESLVPPQQIPISSLGGNEILETLFHLMGGSTNTSKFILDERLVANGIKLRIINDENETIIEILGMTKSIAFYGTADLKEILKLIRENNYSKELSRCRPGKAILYLEGEAVRIARQSPASQYVPDVEDLLHQKNLLLPNCNECIHHKPFLHELGITSNEIS